MVSSAELDTDTFNELDIDIAKLCEMNIAKLTFPIRLVVCRLMDTNTSEAGKQDLHKRAQLIQELGELGVPKRGIDIVSQTPIAIQDIKRYFEICVKRYLQEVFSTFHPSYPQDHTRP